MALPNDTIETAALGRPFQLGMLYDCRKHTLIPGITLWDQEQLRKDTNEKQHNFTKCDVTTSDSIEEKSDSLKISGCLKLSVLGGLVDVGGSAKYFQDTKKSNKQARVTLQYKTTTKIETLTMAHLDSGNVSHPKVFEADTVTHVVTAILYGASAYFVFDRESSSEDEKEQVEVKAKLTFNKLANLDVGVEASLNMNDEEKSEVEKFSCTFHGDFKLTTNPTSFSDAVRVYRDLPNMLGENGEHAVPLRVWLYPLSKLDSRAATLVRDISNELIRFSSDILESFTQTEMRCRDILKDTAAAAFPGMAKKVQTLMHNCLKYKLDFMQKLGSVLPSIRGGGKEESALLDVLKAYEESCFNSKDLDQWLTNKEKELEKLKSFLKQLKNLDVRMDEKLDDLLTDGNVKIVVSFSFTSVDRPDGFLLKLSNYFKPSGMLNPSAESADLQATNTNWLSPDIKQIMRGQFKLFEKLKKMSTSDETKFIFSSKYDESHPGACIFIYEDGSDDAIHFVPPSKPATPTNTGVSYDGVTVELSDPDSATVEYRVEYREKQNQETEWKSHPVQGNQEAVTLSGLKQGTEYEIRATAMGKLSYAVNSDVCRAVTLIVPSAVGPPSEVKVTEVRANTINQCDFSSRYKDVISKSDQSKSGPPAIYKLKAKKQDIGKLKRITSGEKNASMTNITILFVGETGTGKSTMINALVNYTMGVKWEDKAWFKIVQDEKDEIDQTESQTTDVIVYELFGFEGKTLPYSLTIIDTPGFGDTEGAERDSIITQRLFDLFRSNEGVHEVNAVALLLKASVNRVSARLMYVFNSVMSLFGKGMEKNIIVLFTYSDGLLPRDALKAIEAADIKCARNDKNQPIHFMFNNSLTEELTEETELSLKNNVEMSVKGMKSFTDFLEKTAPQKLDKTVNVLTKRLRLTACIQNLQERISLIERKQTAIENNKAVLREYEQEMKKNENFTVIVEEVNKTKEEIKGGGWWGLKFFNDGATCCTVCEENCHYPGCTMARKPEHCGVMKRGYCTSCTNRCPASDHVKEAWHYVAKIEKVRRTLNEMKEKYEKNKKQAENQSSILEDLEEEMKNLTAERSQLLEEAFQLVMKLDQIALNIDAISTHVHLDFLIEKMKENREKVQKLEGMRDRQSPKIKAAMKYFRKDSKE